VGDWRRHRNLYASPSIITAIESRTMRLSGHVACMANIRNTQFYSENLNGRHHSEDRGGDLCGLDISGSGRDQWWVLVNTVINLSVPQKAGNILTS